MKKKCFSSFLSNKFTRNQVITWLIIFLALTLLCLFNFMRFYGSELAEGRPARLLFYFIMETTGAYTILLLIPFALWFIKYFPIRRNNIHTHIPLHILASMVYGVSHTMLMYLSRVAIFWMANMGTYNYGKLGYRIIMEYSHQFLTYWIIYFVYILIHSIKEVQKQKVKAAQLEQQLTRARLQALQMQLHPHFLFNALNMISSTMYEDAKAADRMIANLSDLLRLTLTSKGQKEHSLEEEMEIIGLYVDIMKARYQEKLEVKTDIDVKTKQAMVPSFILQPLVENAVKYSIKSLEKARVKILSQKSNNTMKLIILDNGPGISGNIKQAMKNGIGLSNTIERLENLYGENKKFRLENCEEKGFQVTIEIPFRLSLKGK